MSSLQEHCAEQEEITEACKDGECDHPECQIQTFTVKVGMDVRVYGEVEVEAKSAIAAADSLDAQSVAAGFEITQSLNEIEFVNGRNISLIHTQDEAGGYEGTERDLIDDECSLPYLSIEDAKLIADGLVLLDEQIGSESARRLSDILQEQIRHVGFQKSPLQMKCPKCGQFEEFQVCADIWGLVTENGFDDGARDLPDGGAHYEDGNGCLCPKCGWEGTVGDVS